MNRFFQPALTAVLLSAALVVLTFTFDKAQATIIDNVGPNNQLNKIEQAGNPSNGLHYLDSSVSSGMTLSEALAVTMDGYDIRLATQQEWDDLATAGDLILNDDNTGAHTNGDGLGEVAFGIKFWTQTISSLPNYDVALFDAIGNNHGSSLRLWTDAANVNTYDMARFFPDELIVNTNNAFRNNGSKDEVSWLLVAVDVVGVPEPHTLLLASLASLGLTLRRRRWAR